MERWGLGQRQHSVYETPHSECHALDVGHMGLFPHSFLSLFFFFPSERKKDSLLPAGSRDFSQSMSLCPHSCADPDHLPVLTAEKALVPVVHGTAQPPLFIV